MEKIEAIHPGEILKEEFMEPFVLSQNALAKALHVPPRRINEIVNCKRSITPDTALRLAKFFGTSAEFWLALQSRYDLERTRELSGEDIDREVEFFEALAS